jgi:hypothetical protein
MPCRLVSPRLASPRLASPRRSKRLSKNFRELIHIGLAELVNQELDDMAELSSAFGRIGNPRNPKQRKIAEGWVRMVTNNEALLERFGARTLLPLIPNLVYILGETAANSGLRLAAADRAILDQIFATPSGPTAILGKAYCTSNLVTCSSIGGELRVIGLTLAVLALPEVHTNYTAAFVKSLNPTRLPHEAAGLTELRMVKFSPWALLKTSVTATDACNFLRSLPRLEILVTAMPFPPSCSLPTLQSLVILGGSLVDGENDEDEEHPALPEDREEEDLEDVRERLGRGSGEDDEDDEDAERASEDARNRICEEATDRPLHAEELEFVCNSPNLKLFETTRAIGLPECMGRNTELLRVDLRGGRLAGPLPAGAAKWTKLVDFIAFEQAPRWCVPRDQGGPPQDGATHRGCKVNFHAKAGALDREGEHQPLWHCPAEGWITRFDGSAPWWAWRNLERFWVDVNFLHGTIPPELPDRWPKLRTLDLYSNELTGEVPASLCRLTQLKTLQLQDNRLSGTFPFDEFFRKCPGHPNAADPTSGVATLHIALNADLEGCVTIPMLRSGARQTADMYLNFTKIRLMVKDEGCGGRSDL